MKMQRFSERESILLGYSLPKAFMESSSGQRAQDENSDIDFNDVFGGPPRRSSIHETRYSFSEDSYAFRRSDEGATALRNPWSDVSEKPVFGEEVGMSSRRRFSSNDFYDDIFRGNESLSSSPRKFEMKDPFAPGSQFLSPAKPLPPKAEPFGSSLPPQFSLPAKLNKGMNLPTFGSPPRTSAYKSKDGSSNGSSYYAFSPLSRFSGHANQDTEEAVRNDFQSLGRFSALPRESSTGSEESTNLAKHDETETSGNPKEDSNGSDNSKNGSHFHFSIYKWADKGGVPLAIPLRGSDKAKEKDKLQRCSSANGWIACENIAMESKAKLHGSFRSTDRMRRTASKSFRVEHDKNENSRDDEDGEAAREIEEDNIPMSESKILSSHESSNKKVSADTDLHNSGGEEKVHHSLPPIDLRGKGEKGVSSVGKEPNKPQPKALNLIFDDDDDYGQGNDEISRKPGTKETTMKLPEILDGKNIKKQDVKGKATSKNVEASKTSVKRSPRNSWDNGKTRVRGKVKEFIKIFNQDASSKPGPDTVSESYSSRRKERDTVKPENERSINIDERDEKTHVASNEKRKSSPDIPAVNHKLNGASEKNMNSSVKDTVSNGSKPVVENPARSYEDNFLIEDLTPEEKILPQFGIDPEEIKAIDAKIRQWSNGKQGNIRSLLSTLQYVLWPNNGWKPVPLVDIIEGPSVKRSYQKALLCLHPDKLQQKGAAADQKYIAEKVFDILQESWTHFNSLGSL